jgi:hypothetical protein
MKSSSVERIKVYDPITKRWILESSRTFHQRKASGVDYSHQPRKRVPVFTPPTGGRVTKTFQNYPVDTQNVSWTVKKPARVGERRKLLQTCGDSCMLLPEKLKFPVCNKNPPPCTYNKRGINAAYVRARQWKYNDVADSVQRLRKKLNLDKKKK